MGSPPDDKDFRRAVAGVAPLAEPRRVVLRPDPPRQGARLARARAGPQGQAAQMAVAARRGARLLPGTGGAGRRRRGAGPAQERALDRRFVGLAGADAHHVLDRGDEDLAVADLAGARRLDDRVDRALE